MEPSAGDGLGGMYCVGQKGETAILHKRGFDANGNDCLP